MIEIANVRTAAGVLLPPILALGAIVLVSLAVLGPALVGPVHGGLTAITIETVRVRAGDFAYRAPGAFTVEGIDTEIRPMQTRMEASLDVMVHQVSAADYASCVADGWCVSAGTGAYAGVPVTGVSYLDAANYAQWVSAATGADWRLPTDLEWAYFSDIPADEADAAPEGRAMSDVWLDEYRKMAAQARSGRTAPRPLGSFGTNRFGIADAGGNVWEWTSTCFERVNLTPAGNVLSRLETCGIRVLQGQHRAYMTAFVRDAISGGCAVGTPPDHLGFRLVREVRWHEDLLRFALRLFV